MAGVNVTCDICFDDFGEGKRCPRMLQCGHSYCHECIDKFIKSRSSCCPKCKKKITYLEVNQVPVNYSLVSLLKEDGPTFVESKEDPLVSDGKCSKHNIPNHFMCMNCNLLVCGTLRNDEP